MVNTKQPWNSIGLCGTFGEANISTKKASISSVQLVI